jgi:hypothetical protein
MQCVSTNDCSTDWLVGVTSRLLASVGLESPARQDRDFRVRRRPAGSEAA